RSRHRPRDNACRRSNFLRPMASGHARTRQSARRVSRESATMNRLLQRLREWWRYQLAPIGVEKPLELSRVFWEYIPGSYEAATLAHKQALARHEEACQRYERGEGSYAATVLAFRDTVEAFRARR